MSDNLHLLYGTGTTEGIVAVENVKGKENLVHVFRRVNDEVIATYEKFKPFIYINDKDPVINKLYEGTSTESLMGSNFYNTMIEHENYGFIKWVKKESKSHYMPFLQSQWMIHSQETQFKGMDFDDPLALSCDIETYTKEGYEFPNSSREEDKITIIVMKTNRGDEWALVLNDDALTPKLDRRVIRCKDEKTLLEKWVMMVRKIDPDIIYGHYFFGFDLPYIRDRAMLHGVPLQLGRDGSEITSFMTSIKFAEKSDEYENFSIYGRHILDTYFMAKQYDVVARKLDGYGLKYCVKHLNKASEDRVYIEGSDIAIIWRNGHSKYTREDLIKYAFDDVRESEILYNEWGGAMFELTKMLPLPLQDVYRYGTGNKINSLFQRYYYNMLWSYPQSSEREDYGGGYANTFHYGFFDEDTVYMDVSSLYPSLMEILEIQPTKDELRLFSTLIPLVKEYRYKIKANAKKYEGVDDKLHKKFKANDGAIKIFLNGFYGWLAWAYGDFNYYEGAEQVTSWGRKIAKRMNYEAELLGAKVLRTDTDGSLIIVPTEFRGSEETELRFIKIVEKNLNIWLDKEL